jgi:5-methylthioadenosine/S-adenosylhomocysteine deaminase
MSVAYLNRYLLWAAAAALFTALTAATALASVSGDIRNVILVGKVVTMNATNEVLPEGMVWVRDGVIQAVASDRAGLERSIAETAPSNESLALAFQSASVLRTGGVIYPGMIDLHNHPEYAIYPLMPIKRKYKDRYEWRFYDDDYARRITNLNILLSQAQYFDLGLEVGRYGEYMALAGGTTSLQGGRAGLVYAKEECLVRNIETSPVTPRPAFSRVDIGRDAEEWRRMADERGRGMLVVHLAEGVGPRMANEFEAIKRSGLLGPELIVIHGVGLTDAQLKEMAAARAKLVWSPLSNFILYGQTANVRAAKAAGVAMSLAPDWAPSGSKSMLGELKVADLVNQHQLGRLFSERELVEMVTINPARAMGWENKLGQISAGFLADLLVVDEVAADPYRNLIVATEEQVRMVMVRGMALYGDTAVMTGLRQSDAVETLPRPPLRRAKSMAANCPNTSLPVMSLVEVSAKLQQALTLSPAYVAKRISIEQFSKDLQICGVGKPDDPPTAANASTLLKCRFQLPFENTKLSPLLTTDDAAFFARLAAIPHLPKYLRSLQNYYRAPAPAAQGAKRLITQASAGR